jgi:hypothetical protein
VDSSKRKRTSYPFALAAKRLYQSFCADDRFDPKISWCKQVAKERTRFIERVLKAVPDSSSHDVERWALTFAKSQARTHNADKPRVIKHTLKDGSETTYIYRSKKQLLADAKEEEEGKGGEERQVEEEDNLESGDSDVEEFSLGDPVGLAKSSWCKYDFYDTRPSVIKGFSAFGVVSAMFQIFEQNVYTVVYVYVYTVVYTAVFITTDRLCLLSPRSCDAD